MRIFIPHIILLVLLFSCKNDVRQREEVQATMDSEFDLQRIKKEGVLRALVDYSSTSYFIYRGTAMGFEYDLLKKFATKLGVDLEVIPIRDMDSITEYLNNNMGDLAAANLTVTKERMKKMAFTEAITTTSQVLVQRMPDNWRKMMRHKIDEQLIKEPLELAYKHIHIRKNSSFYERIINLSEEIGEPIFVDEVSGDISTEKLIRMVAEGEIEYTIADEHVALMNASQFSNLDVSTPISFSQKIAWALRKSSPLLLEEINNWLEDFSRTTEFAVIYNKYFKNKSNYRKRIKSDYFSSESGKISPFDNTIKKYSKELGWDWKLLASMIYQESNFDPKAVSWTGALGLMQIMPTTAEHYGVDSNSSAEMNIMAGVKYLKWLDEKWARTIKSKSERIKFVLASYNVGIGHVIDARNLAKKNGKSPVLWDDNVAPYLLKKSSSEYYRDPIVKHGYCRCTEPYKYVKEILNRYEQYQNLVEV